MVHAVHNFRNISAKNVIGYHTVKESNRNENALAAAYLFNKNKINSEFLMHYIFETVKLGNFFIFYKL